MPNPDGLSPDDLTVARKRAQFRAWHRGTREADYMIGGFFDRHGATWSAEELAWFEELLDADDVDIMAWAMNRSDPPPPLGTSPVAATMLEAMRRLDYIAIP